jgi:ACS family glucarate transporter-like MFS transporter
MNTAETVTGTVVRRTGRTRVLIVLLMFGFSVMSYFNRTIMSIAGPVVMKEFALTETEMGSVYSAFLWGYALLMIPCGALADRLGPRLILTAMALGSAVFTALTAWGGTPGLGAYLGIVPSFMIIRLGLGVFTAPIYPACGRMNANWMTSAQRGRTTGWVNSGAGLGGAVSPILFSWMIAVYGWRFSFVLAGLVTAILGAVWFFYVRDHPEEHPSRAPEPTDVFPTKQRAATPWRTLLTDRNLLLLTIGMGALGYFEYIFFYWIYYYLGEVRGLGASQSAFYTSVLFLTWLVMTPVGGWACDRLSMRYGIRGLRMVGAGSLITAALLLFIGINLQQTVASVALMSLSLGFAACSDVAYWTATITMAGTEVGAATGILNAGSNIGGSFAPVLTAFIASQAGWSWGLYFGCLMALVGVMMWRWIGRDAEGRAML